MRRGIAMFYQRLRRSGNSYVVTVPREEVERNCWQEGQFLSVDLTPLELRPELRSAIDDRWARNEKALRSLSDR
jgi:antitoxin component of MazEF toxin-antitoxin module